MIREPRNRFPSVREFRQIRTAAKKVDPLAPAAGGPFLSQPGAFESSPPTVESAPKRFVPPGGSFSFEAFDASSARGVHEVYEFHIDDSVISVIVDDGEMQVIERLSGRTVDVEVHVDATTFLDVG